VLYARAGPMCERSEAELDLDARLTEIDRRLHEIEAELIGEDDPPSPGPVTDSGAGGDLRVSVGPFASTGAVRAFEAELAQLPGVSQVRLAGFEGATRAVFDVQLS
jgi:hypothetical protein